MPKKSQQNGRKKEHFDKVLIPADHADPSSPDSMEGWGCFQARRNVSTTLPAEKGDRRNSDLVQKRRADGAESITAEL